LTKPKNDHLNLELKLGITLHGPINEIFFDTYNIFVLINEPSRDNRFISIVRGFVIFIMMNTFTYTRFANFLGIEVRMIISVIVVEL